MPNVPERGPNANRRPPPISAAPAGKFWDQEDQKWRNFVKLTLPTGIKRGRPNTRKSRKTRKNSRR
jgi:hypothetical protein